MAGSRDLLSAAALSDRTSEDIIIFGGTALGRTHLVAGRLSEDIDLIARACTEAGRYVAGNATAHG